jgi:hypothetical protein
MGYFWFVGLLAVIYFVGRNRRFGRGLFDDDNPDDGDIRDFWRDQDDD